MNQKSWLLNLSLLKTHPAFRAVFIARFISILSLGLLGVCLLYTFSEPTRLRRISYAVFCLKKKKKTKSKKKEA